jgi:polyisoprenyl-phosphate glycosyltransferase
MSALQNCANPRNTMTARPKLSIVCPAYEEEEGLPFFHEELCGVVDELKADYELEILYVDDGSRDGTLGVLKELAARDARVRYLSLSRNFGHQAALTAGLDHATGDVVISMDADLQHPPALIPTLLDKWKQGHDVVLTIREEDKRLTLGKRLTSKLFYRLIRTMSDTDIRPAGSDFRLLSRRAVDALKQLRERHRFLRGMVQWLGLPTAEVPFTPHARKAGQSKYTFRRMLRLAGDGIFSFSLAPLRLAVFVGVLAILGSVLFAGILALRSFWAPDILASGWMWVLITSHLLGGFILVSLGIVGEYVGRVYEQVKERPIYVLKEKSPETGTPATGLSHVLPRKDAA